MIVERITGPTQASVKFEHHLSFQNWVDAPQVNAAFSIRHDEQSIYLYYRVEEPQVRAVNTRYNSPVWADSCVEFFIAFQGDDSYYNFEINAIGTVLGAFGPDRNQRAWLPEELLAQVATSPSLGRKPIENLDEHTTWFIEVHIPVEVLKFSHMDTLTGMDAHANFYKCGDKLKQPHFLSWKQVVLPSPDFHQPRFFGQLSFL